ncbi:unnamed protein product [Darwinula stevensoni]|uniref:Uncharacterized protein n=1 Tax=Darwinula stevensoni TaxID=69355 RepID=A0A7R9FS29_9CRUS|nr:unnamed protein product [Darwinula stevensoni]CAG0902671.1 unnamed protein product [Darwinula stevensoni]
MKVQSPNSGETSTRRHPNPFANRLAAISGGGIPGTESVMLPGYSSTDDLKALGTEHHKTRIV